MLMTRAKKGFIKEMTKRNFSSAKAARRLLSLQDFNVVCHSRSLHILNYMNWNMCYYICVSSTFSERPNF